MLALRALNEELGNPSATKLLQAAKKQKLKVTKAQVAEVVKEDSTREVFAQPQPQKGAHATNDEGAIWQADLVDLKEQGEKYKYALSVTDVFSRLTKTEPLETKAPGEVWAAFTKILDKFPKKPTKLDVDADEAFKGAFSEGAESRGIVVQQKNSDPNAVAVSDAAIQSIKSNLFRDMAKKGSDKWSDKLEKAEKAYNSQPHESLMGEAPKDVKDSDVVRFRLLQENAEKLRSNAKQLDQRQKRLEDLGAFRPMLGNQSFQRGFKARYSSEVKKVDSVVLLDIYAASEKPIKGIDSRTIVETLKQQGHKDVTYLKNHNDINALIKQRRDDFDILITQGAGSVSIVCNSIIGKWKV